MKALQTLINIAAKADWQKTENGNRAEDSATDYNDFEKYCYLCDNTKR